MFLIMKSSFYFQKVKLIFINNLFMPGGASKQDMLVFPILMVVWCNGIRFHYKPTRTSKHMAKTS